MFLPNEQQSIPFLKFHICKNDSMALWIGQRACRGHIGCYKTLNDPYYVYLAFKKFLIYLIAIRELM